MKIERKSPSAGELASMYQEAGWIDNPDPDKMLRSVNSDSEWFVARDSDSSLMGIGRLITDYVRYGFVIDIIVKEVHQNKGVGKSIMQAVIAQCHRLDLESVNLWPSEGKVSFYEELGFYSLSATQPHMKLRLKN